jgi:hypothetical protein
MFATLHALGMFVADMKPGEFMFPARRGPDGV